MGPGLFSTWATTPDATHYPRIYAATGNRHNGISATTGAYIQYTVGDTQGLGAVQGITNFSYLRVEGIAAKGALPSVVLPNFGFWFQDVDNLFIDGCLSDKAAVAGFEISCSTGTMNATVQNCIGKNSGDTDYILEVAAPIL